MQRARVLKGNKDTIIAFCVLRERGDSGEHKQAAGWKGEGDMVEDV